MSLFSGTVQKGRCTSGASDQDSRDLVWSLDDLVILVDLVVQVDLVVLIDLGILLDLEPVRARTLRVTWTVRTPVGERTPYQRAASLSRLICPARGGHMSGLQCDPRAQ